MTQTNDGQDQGAVEEEGVRGDEQDGSDSSGYSRSIFLPDPEFFQGGGGANVSELRWGEA